MTLLDVIETAIADAVRAGAEWHAIVQCRQDSAEVGRQQRQWVQDLRYQQIVRHHQRQAAESIGRAILRLTIERDGRRQMAMLQRVQGSVETRVPAPVAEDRTGQIRLFS